MLAKKRQRSATQPITRIEVFAAKSTKFKEEKSHDDLDLIDQPFRGRLLSIPTTNQERREVTNGSAPQKYVRPKTPPPPPKTTKQVPKTRMPKKQVAAKVDSGRSGFSRASTTRRSVRTTRTKPETSDSKTNLNHGGNKGSHSSLVDAKHPAEQARPMRRSASVRVSGSSLGSSTSVKAAAERAVAAVDARKKTPTTKFGDSIRARATAKVDSRRTPTEQVKHRVPGNYSI